MDILNTCMNCNFNRAVMVVVVVVCIWYSGYTHACTHAHTRMSQWSLPCTGMYWLDRIIRVVVGVTCVSLVSQRTLHAHYSSYRSNYLILTMF